MTIGRKLKASGRKKAKLGAMTQLRYPLSTVRIVKQTRCYNLEIKITNKQSYLSLFSIERDSTLVE